MPGAVKLEDESTMRPLVLTPDDISLVAAAADGAGLVLVPTSRLGKPDVFASSDRGHQREGGHDAAIEILDPTVEPRKQPLTSCAEA